MGVGISLYDENRSDNPMKSSIVIEHSERYFWSDRSSKYCGAKNTIQTDSSPFRTAMKRGYFKCWKCDAKMKFRKQKYNKVVLWLNEDK
jgi:hypothetical protein|tara:strand:- start:16 stop:282 length:267 start_codon:yes stop_codon:yes gene_type:complete